jgi:translocation and assembly module TamA
MKELLYRLRILYILFFFGLSNAVPLLGAEPVQVLVEGVEGEALENVQASLALPPGLVRNGTVDRFWLQRFQRQIPGKVRQALEPFGYYDAQVSSGLEVTADKNYHFNVNIEPGEPVRIEEVYVGIVGPGANRKVLQSLAEGFPLHKGDVLRQDTYEEAKGELKAKALDLGYLNAEFSVHVIQVHRAKFLADIELVLATGRLYHFGEVRFIGASDYPEPFLRRYLPFKRGDVFSYAKLGQAQKNFLDSDRFKEVSISAEQELARDVMVPIDLHLTPSPRKRLRSGIGYGTDTGGRLSLRYKDVNIFHLGHELAGDLLLAEFKQSLTASYTIPSTKNIYSYTALRLGSERENVDTYDSRFIFAEIERTRGFGQERIGSVYVRLLQEDFTIGKEDARSRLLLPGVRFSKVSYTDPVRPEKGYRYSLEAKGGHQVLGSDTGLLQFLAAGNALVPLPGRLSLFTRLRIGATLQNEPFREIPASLRFFAGGDQSVRGYAYQSLGPQDAEGAVVGGKNLLVGSVEFERALGKNWGLAVFYDAGNAFNALSDINWAQGAGIGVRRYTLIGPVKLDLARQVGVKDPSFRLHVTVGFAW